MIPKEGREYIIDAVIFNLHRYCFEGNNNRRELSEGDLLGTIRANGLGPVLGEGDTEEITDELISYSIIQVQEDEFAGRFFVVTDELAKTFNEKARDKNSPLFQMNRFGADWITAAAKSIYEASETGIPKDARNASSVEEKTFEWNQPDTSRRVTQKSIGQIQSHLGECIKIISTSNFTQEEKSQISGLLRVCEQLIELPTPKVGLIKQVLGWLRDVAAIKELVEQIIEIMEIAP